MILLITPMAKGQECGQALQQATSEPTLVAATLRQAANRLRSQEFSAVVMDRLILDAEPDESEALLQHIGTAVPVYVNFAISGVPRIVRELQISLQRRQKETQVARQFVQRELRNELKGTATALLLSSEMALKSSDLPAAQGKMQTVFDLAQEMCGKLGIAE